MDEQSWLASTDPQEMLAFAADKMSARRLRLFAVAAARLGGCGDQGTSSYHALRAAEDAADGKIDAEQLARERDAFRAQTPGMVAEFTMLPLAKAAARQIVAHYDNWPRVRTKRWADLAADLLRDIVGNPWRPVVLPLDQRVYVPCPDCLPGEPDPWCDDCSGAGRVSEWRCEWLIPTVVALAHAAYDDERARKACRACLGCGRRLDGGGACPVCQGWGSLIEGQLCPDRLGVLADALEDAGCVGPVLEHLRSPGPHVRGCWALDLVLGKE